MSSTSSMICKNFAQNAWKKDLCSNCFKSEVEHNDWLSTSATAPVVERQSDQQSMTELRNTEVNSMQQNSQQNSAAIECRNTTTTIVISKKSSNNSSNNFNTITNSSTQLLMNTKKLNTTHVSSHNSLLINGIKTGINSNTKDCVKQYNNNNTNNSNINNCGNDLRKIINTLNNSFEEKKESSVESKTTQIVAKNQTNFPLLKDNKIILQQNNYKNTDNSCANSQQKLCLTPVEKGLTPIETVSKTNKIGANCSTGSMSLIGILKTITADTVIKYRPKNKCLVFKEGDPLIIGYNEWEYGDSEEDSGSDDDFEQSDEEYDDPLLYTSDDKELRELTRVNTKFNSNFANFSINTTETKVKQIISQSISSSSKPLKPLNEIKVSFDSNSNNCVNSSTTSANVVIESSVGHRPQPSELPIVATSCPPDGTIPKVCEQLVQTGITETFEAIISCNSSDNQSPTFGSTDSDVLPMSTSSDSYSSGDEKEYSQTIEIQNYSPIEESTHLRTDSESDNSSTNSDSGIEAKDEENRVESVLNRVKPQLPVKPNIKTTKTIITEENQQNLKQNTIEMSSEEVVPEEEESEDGSDISLPPIVNGHMSEEIDESVDGMNGIDGKFVKNFENLNNNYLIHTKHTEPEPRVNEKRELKLAELAHELELVRHMKRPAPKPPANSPEEPLIRREEESRKPVNKQTVSFTVSAPIPSSAPTTKHRFSSIRKLLHKKSSADKWVSDRIKEHSIHINDSSHTVIVESTPGSDRKAWKQSDFDRSNIKIVHPIDFGATTDHQITIDTSESVYGRPEAPPRTPKPSRPSVPARKRNKSVPNPLYSSAREPPPRPPNSKPPALPMAQTVSSSTAPVVDMNVGNDLNSAYNELAKSNYKNLLAIKSKIESTLDRQYKWSDFEVTNALQLGSALLYKDSILSRSGQSVHLMVLENCYTAPIVTRFSHHEEQVLVLDQQWTDYYLLSEWSESEHPLKQKQINSLILQLYSILEYFENNNCNQFNANTINTIIICASDEDILLIVPQITVNTTGTGSNQCAHTYASIHITLHQFLAQVLAKLLPNSLFESVGHVLSRPTVQISHSKTIVQLIAFQIPVPDISAGDSHQINYWFDISRSKFINQFCSLNDRKGLTQLDYIYLKFLCNNINTDLIRNSIDLMINSNSNRFSQSNQ